jgi:hypothetical protein
MPKRKRDEDGPSASLGKKFSLMDGKVDVLDGLIMHEEVISEDFENELISFVRTQCDRGRCGELKKPTYLRASGERSRGNQRESIMYGGFFDFNRARPGKRGLVPPFPPILERLVDRLVDGGYLPRDVRPDSCIINMYDVGDCIPPHVDHGSYHRPISTLSLLGVESMLVGTRFRTVRSCTWEPTCGKSIPLARRSLLVLGGNSANVAKHCISSCVGKRISITLRKQPPPDWRPDVDELVGRGGKRSKRDDDGSRVDGGGMNMGMGPMPKKKSLSGSAKRRKKVMTSRVDGLAGVNTVKEGSSNSHNDAKKASVNVVASNGRASEKQARRNARRLERKKGVDDSTRKNVDEFDDLKR